MNLNKNQMASLGRKMLEKAGVMHNDSTNSIIRKAIMEFIEHGDKVSYVLNGNRKTIAIEEKIEFNDVEKEYYRDGLRGYRVNVSGNKLVDLPVNEIEWQPIIKKLAKRVLTDDEIKLSLFPEYKVAKEYQGINLDGDLNFGIEIEGGTEYYPVEDFLETIYQIGFDNVYDASVEVMAEFSDEIVMNGFQKGNKFLKPMYKVISVLRDYDFFYNNSCGIHFHLSDANDNNSFKPMNLFRFVKLYVEFEDILYKLLPNHRINNDNSAKLSDTNSSFYKTMKNLPRPLFDRHLDGQTVKDIIGTAWYQTNSFEGYKHDKYDQSRYAGLNIHSYFYRGTLEFRHFDADYNKIPYWADLLNCLYDASKYNFESTTSKLAIIDHDNNESLVKFFSFLGVSNVTLEFLADQLGADLDEIFENGRYDGTTDEDNYMEMQDVAI
ncbi:MAG: amidoligase family protein [bacterium]